MVIFHTISLPNYEQERILWVWGESPEGLPYRVLAPGDPVTRCGDAEILERLEERGVEFERLCLGPSDISPEAWCNLFDFNINEPLDIALYKAIRTCKKKYGIDLCISQIRDIIELDGRASPRTVGALVNGLDMADEWGFFEDSHFRDVWKLLYPHAVTPGPEPDCLEALWAAVTHTLGAGPQPVS